VPPPARPLPAGELDREKLGRIVFSDPAARRRLNGATHLPVFLELFKALAWCWLTLKLVVVGAGLCSCWAVQQRPRGETCGAAPAAPAAGGPRAAGALCCLPRGLRLAAGGPARRRPGCPCPCPPPPQVIDMPLLFETGFNKWTRPNVVVACDVQVQVRGAARPLACAPACAPACLPARLPACLCLGGGGGCQGLERPSTGAPARPPVASPSPDAAQQRGSWPPSPLQPAWRGR
jgi:hypothetical protein